ncbi:protein C3orf33 homolog isoform X3 [Daphnia pulicaria]|uniref:protein C3orf33 homolog isoform X3 n=1 Tax=Daphnia pulicaria TaxID=35523 RepID=UPI001EEACE27|nr:protein C3orf33 homolog isoform X3 [Daphnia pulicaria]
MKKPSDLESRINEILDRNIRIIQYSVYAVGLIGLAVVAKSTHIFSKFTPSKTVPREFVTRAVKLQGKVKGIEFLPVVHQQEQQPLYAVRLHIEHIPIVNLWTRPKQADKLLEKSASSLLKIELVGVNLTTLDGANRWIKSPLESNPVIWFRLYGVNSNTNLFYASVLLHRPWWKFWRQRDLSSIVLKHNEGVVASYLPSQQVYYNNKYPAYYRKLLYCAIKNKNYN